MNLRKLIQDNWSTVLFVIPVGLMVGAESDVRLAIALVALVIAAIIDVGTTEEAKNMLAKKLSNVEMTMRYAASDLLGSVVKGTEKFDGLVDRVSRRLKDRADEIRKG